MRTTLFLLGFWALACHPIKPKPQTDKPNGDLVVVSALSTRMDTIRFQPDDFSSLVALDTRFGTLQIELFFHTIEYRENFIKLIKSGFYENLLFHRVIKNFMIQGGDPGSRNAKSGARLGGGGNGMELPAQIHTEFFHVRGALAAARQPDEVNPDKKSSGCQFYLVQGSSVTPDQLDRNERKYSFAYSQAQRNLYRQIGGAAQLDMEYTVFGRVYDGLHLLDSLAQVPTDNYDRPLEDLKMKWRVVRE